MLSPLKSKGAEEVAHALLPVFLTSGAPAVLQSDNDREFVNSVITELSTHWPKLQLVTGRLRYPRRKGVMEHDPRQTKDLDAIE